MEILTIAKNSQKMVNVTKFEKNLPKLKIHLAAKYYQKCSASIAALEKLPRLNKSINLKLRKNKSSYLLKLKVPEPAWPPADEAPRFIPPPKMLVDGFG